MFIKKRGKAKQEKDKANRAAAVGDAGDAAASGEGAARSVMTNDDDFDHRLGNYQLMEAIGKGGYGTVYRGLNIERGMTVAVKRVNLQGIPHEELESIEMEIRLLQNLDHPNIVKYLDSIRSEDYLNIILEFVENGSLSSLLGKFQGNFPEQLCAHYITQVLKGLQYLHTQGVIHRDIKGANILSTKEGQVKLADFGVATKLNESRKSDSVVGTPYWMAPEIIEMTGQQSSACDIWSVGCTCVELLTGKPPYFDLQQMPALFRIVQDEHPPLPDNISPALEDFLLQCFCEETRVLTDRGFLFVEEIEALLDSERSELRYLCYDKTLEGFVYRAGKLVRPAGEHQLCELTQPAYASRWDELDQQEATEAGSLSSNHLSLRVTRDHEMFLQLGRALKGDEASAFQWEAARDGGAPNPPHKLTVDEVLTAEAEHAGLEIRFQAYAPNGHLSSTSESEAAPYAEPLNLTTTQQQESFLELYGFWLGGSGSLQYTETHPRPIVAFHQSQTEDHEWLRSILAQCGLRSDDWTQTTHADGSVSTQVTRASWGEYFDSEYWIKFEGGRKLHRMNSGDSAEEADAVPAADFGLSGASASVFSPSELLEIARLKRQGVASPTGKSAQWFGGWCLGRSLNKTGMRLVLSGLRRAAGSKPGDRNLLFTSDISFRDQIMHACLLAGYCAHFECVSEAGETGDATYCATARTWVVAYAEPNSPQDEAQAHPSMPASAIKPVPKYAGRVWCVTVQHDDHLVVVQRAQRSNDGLVVRASKPVIVGQCWQKDPNRRIDAHGLLKHPWLKKSVEIFEVEELKRKMMQNEAAMAKLSLSAAAASSPPHAARKKPGVQKPAAKHDSEEEDWDGEEEPAARAKLQLPGAAKPKKQVSMQPSAHASDNEDDWDEPDEEPAAAAPGSGGKKPGHRPALSTAAFPVDNKKRAAQVKAANMQAAADDDEPTDLVIKLRAPTDDGDPFADFSGDDDDAAGGMDTPDEDAETVVSKTSMKTIKPTVVAAPAAQQQPAAKTAPTAPGASSASFSLGGTSVNGAVGAAPAVRKLDAFVENDEEEMEGFEDLVDDDGDLELKAAAVANAGGAAPPGHHHSGSTLSLPAAAGHKGAKTSDAAETEEQEDEADPFDDITFEDGEDKADDVLLNRSFLRVLEVLSPDSSERAVLDACEKLHEMGKTSPEQVRNLMTIHGVIPIMEMLEVSNAAILHAILKVVNNIVGKSQKFQQSMSLVGLIPAIIRFGGPSYPREIRMEAANFVRQFCYASDWTRKMFIACDGLPVLVSFLSMEEYSMSKTLVWNAIDCIRHVFDITTNPKNDFCRLFCKFGLLEPLTRTLQEVQADRESEDAPAFVLKIAGILHMFSQGDKVVKLHFARPSVIESMLRVLPSVPQEPLILLLKSIRNISMDSTTLDLLEAAGAIPALIPFLDPMAASENQHQVLLTMYYLCQIKGSRQEQAALSGIIPHLQRFIREEHSLKQFAYPIIFLLAKTSWRTRQELKKYQGVQFYVDILTSPDVYWRSAALDCIATWMSASVEDTARVSFLLNTASNINKLLRVFRDTDDATQFDKMLPSFRKILATSIKVNQSLGRTPDFTREIRDRLCRHAASNNIRINLLKMVSLLFAAHPSPATLAAEADLTPVLHALLEDKSAVIVGSLTQKLLTQYLGDTKPADADTPNA